MARVVVLSLTVILAHCVLQCYGAGARGFPSSSASSSGCDSRTRLAKLNCPCALSNQNQNCLLGTNSFCINGKCSCRGNMSPDWSTGFFCRDPFIITSPRTKSATVCAVTLPTSSATVVPYGNAASQAARFITYENAAGSVTCTPNPAIGTNTKLNFSATQVNATATELIVRGGTGATGGVDTIVFTCVDGRNVAYTVSVAYTAATTASCA